jgi:uncharacterized protein YraI
MVSVCLCAVLTVVGLTGARLVNPAPALAATGTLSIDTPLHGAPDHAAPVIALLPEGTVVSVDGPPIDGFYPVSTGDLTGWMRGETLLLEKDPIIVSGDAGSYVGQDAAWLPADQSVPMAQEASDAAAPVETVAPVDPLADPAPVTDATATEALPEAAPTDPTLGEPLAADTSGAPAPEPLAAAPVEPAPVGAGGTAPEPAPIAGAAPVEGAAPVDAAPAESSTDSTAEAPTGDTLASDQGTTAPPSASNAAPQPAGEAGPVGPAGVSVDAPIRVGPAPSYDLVFTVPGGSTVEQTGHVVDGYVTVRYKEVTGWIAVETLEHPADFAPEEPENPQREVETKTPNPGSGVAYATVDLSLRAGPSANEEPVVVVPAGSRLVLTGVMEGGFQRVTYGDEIGWVADEFLTTPPDPGPEGGKGKQEQYSRREIVRIIYDAADRYDQSRSAMLRVAECESNLDPYAVNPSGSYGLFQFIRSTWKSTPYGDKDIFDPKANANAAGWMWAQGRKSEWVCQ